MPIIDISRELTAAAPYAGDPPPRMHALATHEQDGYQLQAIVMSLHAATHVDAPLHFLPGGSDAAALPLDAFVGPCTVLTAPAGALDAAFFLRSAFGAAAPAPHGERLLLRGPGYLLKAPSATSTPAASSSSAPTSPPSAGRRTSAPPTARCSPTASQCSKTSTCPMRRTAATGSLPRRSRSPGARPRPAARCF